MRLTVSSASILIRSVRRLRFAHNGAAGIDLRSADVRFAQSTLCVPLAQRLSVRVRLGFGDRVRVISSP